jgi:hypothetical protein
MAVKFTKPEINVREKLAELDKPSGIAGEAMLRAETPQEQQALIGVGRRNMLINGDMKVSQRGDFTTASSMPNAYKLDRWLCDLNGTATVQHTTGHDIPGTPAICKAIKLVQTVTGNNYLGIRQKIEDPTQYVGRTFTYSGWVRSNTPNARLECYIHGTDQPAIGPNHSGNGEWEFLSFTFTMSGIPSNNWLVDVYIDNGAYTNTTITAGEYVEATMLQLEAGKVATPFEHRSYGEELALCERYYQRVPVYHESIMGQAYSTTAARFPVQLPVEMRTDPTITVPGPGTSGNSMKPLNASLSWPGGSGNNAVTTKSPRHFYVTCMNYSGLVAGNASTLYAGSNYTYIKCDAEL